MRLASNVVMNAELTSLDLQTTSQRVYSAAGATAMAAGAVAVAYFDPTNAGFFPVCPLYVLTGFACPGCGLTRAFHALFHGDIVGALDYNALLPAFAFVIGYFFVSLVLGALRGRGLSFTLFRPRLVWGFMVLGIIFAVLRNLPVYPFNILYP